MNDTKAAAVQAIKNEINKLHGSGSISSLGDVVAARPHVVVGGVWGALDDALGVGGLPKGAIVDAFGTLDSGQRELAYAAAAAVQKAGGVTAWIDVSHRFAPAVAEAAGVAIDQLLVSQPSSGDQALEIAQVLVGSGTVDLVIVDGTATFTFRDESGRGLQGVQCTLDGRDTRATDDTGRVSFRVSLGDHILLVEKAGFQTEELPFTVQ